jgi:pantoate--beta-alanine ligase
MLIVTEQAALQSQLATWRDAGETIAFVPTMGHLHEGHLRLVDEARRCADRCVVSIFVNPTQFSANEDLASYPRTEDNDAKLLQQHHVDVLFMPSVDLMYPQGQQIDESCIPPVALTGILCGRSRPGHFAGVATVVKHLFALVSPDVAIFGEKDYQQLQVIRWLVAEHGLPIRIIAVPTVREPSGLAMSSRNSYLSPVERAQAAALYASLQAVCQRLRVERPATKAGFVALAEFGTQQLLEAGISPDYLSIRAAEGLAEAEQASEWRILAAGYLGTTRLIDNLACKNSK